MAVEIKKDKVLIRPQDIKPSSKDFEVIGVINPSAIRLPNKDIVLYVRVIEKLIKFDDEKNVYSPRMVGGNSFKLVVDKFSKKEIEDFSELDFLFKDGTKRLTFISHFRRVVLDKGGFRIKSIDKKPSFFGLRKDGEFGVEDSRVVKIGDKYVMTYVALSRDMNVSTSCAVSKDFKKWKRLGVIFREQNKDVVLFPETIEGRYFALNRPEGSFQFTQPDILVSSSEDLESWGRPRSLKLAKGRSWDGGKLGAGPPPIKMEGGWLMIYHGIVTKKVRKRRGFFGRLKSLFREDKGESVRYYGGAALLDLKNPSKVIKKVKDPLFAPNKSYEKSPYENKRVVFPTGLVEDLNGNDLLVYSGGGDVLVTAKKIALSEILSRLETF